MEGLLLAHSGHCPPDCGGRTVSTNLKDCASTRSQQIGAREVYRAVLAARKGRGLAAFTPHRASAPIPNRAVPIPGLNKQSPHLSLPSPGKLNGLFDPNAMPQDELLVVGECPFKNGPSSSMSQSYSQTTAWRSAKSSTRLACIWSRFRLSVGCRNRHRRWRSAGLRALSPSGFLPMADLRKPAVPRYA
jgi:hypothetical protein